MVAIWTIMVVSSCLSVHECSWLKWKFCLQMGLKREHRETVDMLRKEHDEELFKIRGEQALPVQYHVEKIQQVQNF